MMQEAGLLVLLLRLGGLVFLSVLLLAVITGFVKGSISAVAEDGERSRAMADFIHVTAFFFLSSARVRVSLMELVQDSVSSVLNGVMLVRDCIINLVRAKSSWRSKNLSTCG